MPFESAMRDIEIVSSEDSPIPGMPKRKIVRAVLPPGCGPTEAMTLVLMESRSRLKRRTTPGIIIFAYRTQSEVNNVQAFVRAAATRNGKGFRDGYLLDPAVPDDGGVQVSLDCDAWTSFTQ